MEGIIGILVIVSLYLLVRARNRKKDFKQLQVDFELMKQRLKRLEKGISRTKVRILIQEELKELQAENLAQIPGNQLLKEKDIAYQRPEKTEVIPPEVKPKTEEQDTEHIPSFSFEEVEKLKQTAQKKAAKKPKVKSQFWLGLEKQFAENWTGILGAGILVLGIGFFAVYAALLLDAVYRFAMLTGISGILVGAFYFLKKKDYWNDLAFWLRSSAAAIFLFACLGSGGIEGLQWIDNSLYALLLLLLGVGVNLSLSLLEKRQNFASLHILISLLALGVAQSATEKAIGNPTLLIVASAVTLFGIMLTYRSKKWDKQLFLSVSSFFAFHLFWYFHARPENGFSTFDNVIGIITVVLVSVTAALGHYREVYANKKFDVLPFLAHLTNWFYFGIGLSLHSTGSKYKTFIIILGAIAGFVLARRAKKLNIPWLYRTDTLMSYLVLLFASSTLIAWEVDWLFISVLIFVETSAFTLLIMQQKERFLYQVASFTVFLSSFGLLGVAFLSISISEIGIADWQKIAVILIFALLIAALAHFYDKEKRNAFFEKTPRINLSFLGLWIPLTLFFVFALTYQYTGSEYVVFTIALALVFLRQKFQSDWLAVGMSLFLIAYHLLAWNYLYYEVSDLGILRKFIYGLPFLLLSASFIYFSYVKSLQKHFKFIGIYAFGIQIGILSFLILNVISPMIIGVLSLVFSVLFLEIAQFVRKKYSNTIQNIGSPDRYLLHLAYGFLLVFFARHILVHLQLETYFLFLKLRLWIEIFALLVLLYWASAKAPKNKPIYKSWIFVQPLFIELSLIFIVFTVSLEFEPFWHLLIWIGMAFGILGIGLRFEGFSRLRFYSILFYWATAFQLAFLMSTPVPSRNWYEQYQFSGVLAIVLQFVFLYVFYNYSNLKNTVFPKSLKYFENLSTKVAATLNVWVLYPLIFSVAVFLFFEFDKAILTLLWVVECLAIFVLSLVLRANQFRYMALAGLAICVVRLLFFDMSQASILTKALVFVGVGIIMLGINALYSKYKDRFDE